MKYFLFVFAFFGFFFYIRLGDVMGNSKYVDVVVYSPNCNKPRNHSVDRITPHIMVGQLSAEACGNIFKPSSRAASSNYGIGKNGEVGLYVDEVNRSWCSSNRDNDHRAITIECACDKEAPYALNDAVWNKLILLCVDICERYGKTKLIFLGSLKATNEYKQKEDEMLLTAHRWFAATECPGSWLYNKFNELAFEVSKKLSTQENDENMGTIKTYRKGQRTQLSKNFVSTEFDCHGSGCCGNTKIDNQLVEILQKIRDYFEKAVNITSGYRCPTHNANVGGASQSYHTKGQAADFYISGVKPAEIGKYAESIGVLGIGVYDDFVHIDTRTKKFFWKGHSETPVDTFGGLSQKEETEEVPPLLVDAQKQKAIQNLEEAQKAIQKALNLLK